MTCAFHKGKYYYIPVKNGEDKLLKTIYSLPIEYDDFAGQTEIKISDELLGCFNEILWHANKFAKSSVIFKEMCKELNIEWDDNDSDYEKLVKYAKLNRNESDEDNQDSFMYIISTKLRTISTNGEITFTATV